MLTANTVVDLLTLATMGIEYQAGGVTPQLKLIVYVYIGFVYCRRFLPKGDCAEQKRRRKGGVGAG